MKATELRIGNLIEFNNYIQPKRIVKIEPMFFRGFVMHENDFEISNFYQPIPLTPKKLVELGFKKVKIPTSLDSFFITNYQKDDFIVYILEDSFEVELKTSAGQFNLFINFKKEVHVLQNIYFSLKFEELTLKN